MLENVLKYDIIPQLKNIFSKVLIIDCFETSFINKIKETHQSSISAITTDGDIPGLDASIFSSIHHIRLGTNPLPFEEKTFTLIIGDNIFSHCVHLPQTIKELHRILSDEGVIITTEPNLQHYSHILRLLNGEWDETLNNGKAKLHFFTPASLAHLLDNSSFHVRHLALVESDPPNSFPLTDDNFVHWDRYHFGPLTPDEHKLFLIKKFLVIASKSNGGEKS